MKVEQLSTERLARMAAPWNPRTISDHDTQALARSMREFGVVEPIVVNRRTQRIVGGHQRVKAALLSGIERLPVVYVDLDATRERQLNLALNRISGEFDVEKLSEILKDLEREGADLELTGFTQEELDKLLAGLDIPEDGLTDPELVPELSEKPKTQRGDIIELGPHRLMCGDSSDLKQVQALMAGEMAHLLNLDPPYNVYMEPRSNVALAAAGKLKKDQKRVINHGGEASKVSLRPRDRRLKGDFMPDEEYGRLLRLWLKNAAAVTAPGRSFYLWGGYSNISNYPPAIEEAGLYFSQAIVWVKDVPVLTRKDFMGHHELCFCGWKKGAPHYFNPGVANATDVWRVKGVSRTQMVHLTERPLELAERAIQYSTRRGENVLDLFGGSGWTMIAAECLGRRAFLMEIDQAYCDVIIKRWQAFTGRRAKNWRGNRSTPGANK